MLIGYVSDERYVAVADVLLEFQRNGQTVAVVRSTPRGAVHADVDPGEYHVTLVKDGFGSKSVTMTADPQQPHHFRLLSDCILGYVWPRAVKSGERSEFRVHSPDPYRLSLWRYGWQREFFKLLGWFDEHGPRAVMQITPDGDYTQTGAQWNKIGYGSPNHTQFVTGPERSGLYYLHAKGERSGEFFSFPWVVAPAKPSAQIAVLASTNTWLAYNNFGGRSNYINAHQLPPQPTVNARQDLIRYTKAGSFNVWGFEDNEYLPLSFERPEPGNAVREHEEVTDPIEGRLPCGMAPAEWRLLGWLEHERFAYDYYSEWQLHSGALDLDAYQILILSVHPEYWSRQMYQQRVKGWVYRRGGKLIYLGGNGLNCEVEFLGEDRLRFKTHLAPATGGALGMPAPDNPDIYLESRMHRTLESEANLLGVVCTESGIMTAAPYRVVKADHWIFAGTGLQNGDLFGEKSLQERVHGGASGHETDKMSPHSPPGTVLLAKGINPNDGGAEIVYYETASPSGSRGAVFSVGSITYVPCLLVDDAISRITSNVITTLLSGKRKEMR
ncbi:N,N-dimethylformamidase beta subunit family domain-containing protein [Candidatus Entotheonella palauensis]|uniref:N,N-dimethylformamidase beta subunit family domain-containing protein n=1 Tax=Candidatus Entotheonella palauensis TaxID=93172 RepID=UPI000B7FE942|nr:N,N-dimethylformamidase beta subunit family domain-containing protein [Candidatus Entotheonella palauensis]